MTHDLSYAVNCSMLFPELPLLQRPAAAKAAGFDAIEIWWPFEKSVPSDAEVDTFVAAVQEADVQLVGLNFAAGDMPGGDRGLVSWPARSTEFRDNVAVTDNLAIAAAAAARIDALVLVEPVSGAAHYPLRTAAEAVAVIERTKNAWGATNLALLADLFHLTVNGDDVAKAITEHGPRIGHVQIADAPGRGEPGTGSIGIDEHLAAIEAGGYRGWVGLEYKPTTPSTEESLRWLPRQRRAAAAAHHLLKETTR